MIELGGKIKEARRRLKITQAGLAEKTGVSRTTINQLENGTISDIGIRKVMHVLEYLGLELTVRPAGSPPTLDELTAEWESAEREKT